MKPTRSTIFNVAKNAGLEIEYLDAMPDKYDGHLDPHDTPRDIAVNRSLPAYDQVFVIAREIGRLGQLQRPGSTIFDKPNKWEMLATAPNETK